MNILLDSLPRVILINNQEFEINSDFRTGIKFELLMDSNRTQKDKIISAIKLFYPIIPYDINEAVNKMVWFYQGNETATKRNKNVESKSCEKIYSFEYDQNIIYTAFLYYYKIDLNSIDYLHWWVFKSLLSEMPEESNFKKILMYRSIPLSANMSPEQQKFYAQMKVLYKIPDGKTQEQKANIFASILARGMTTKENEV